MKKLYKGFLVILVVFIVIISIFLTYYSPIPSMDNASSDKKIGVVVTVLPQAEFVEKVGGDKVTVTTMVPPGADPHTYEPMPEQLKNLSSADVYFMVGSGIDFELVWMDKFTSMNSNMEIINSSENIALIKNSNTDDEHETNTDPHVWVSPKNAKIMVENVYKELSSIDPANKEYYKKNKDEYLKELDKLDSDIIKSLEDKDNRLIMVYHPAWGYFCRDYSLKQIAIQNEGKEPTPQGIASLIKQAKEENIKVIFVSPQFSSNSAEVIAENIGGEVVRIDPLAKNYVDNLYKVVDAFKNS
ncbi:MAG: zinc ABC transporter substrate-binding protein [Methanobacterium sp. BRmetb2]|nr:MAG: zinc ABC transporter substrate-binding protein [Methanobacterium sp. BRmetb2]